jgi:deoxyribodipyrimidine photo-lyase
MRCLNSTGFMHNRLRMVVAMFLCKHLRIDWRWGERYFLQQLQDADYCSNNGGWQWCAGSGVDAAPYFRIFNPTTQSQKFDAEGVFIRQWLPELAHLPSSAIHEPAKHNLRPPSYPSPIVDHAEARQACLHMYKQANGV